MLKIKTLKLFDSSISFINKNRIDWKRLARLIDISQKTYINKFEDAGKDYSNEHMLLHLTHKNLQDPN